MVNENENARKTFNIDKNTRKFMALVAMVIIGAVLLAITGEVAKYVVPPETFYFQLINKVYILSAAIFLLMLGIDKVNMNTVRNMIAIFAFMVVIVVILWQLDKMVSSILSNDTPPPIYGQMPSKYLTLALQSLDILAILGGAIGAFLVLLKGLDKVKELLIGTSKSD
ncbi:MAG TPA: hypothetical protein VK436_10685 [Methanocella sp.]|nr:hypothetical protein [Methanocella sp.]